MGDAVKSIFGGETSSQKAQRKALRKQEREQDAIEAGQRKIREGGYGNLAFVEEDDQASVLGGTSKRTKSRGVLAAAAKMLGGDA